MFSKCKISVISLLLGVIVLAGVLGYLYFSHQSFSNGNVLSAQMASERTVQFINEKFLHGSGNKATAGSTDDLGSVYRVKVKIGDEEYTAFITKDGKYFFPEGYEIPTDIASINAIPKREKPDVKLFVMSYCPYGLQAEKAFLPVYDLLKDYASMGIYFVDYAMHEKKEVEENLRQYCIQKDQSLKYRDYLSCFVQSGDSEKCLKEASIDQEELSDCVSKTDNQYHIMADYNDKSKWISGRYPPFDIHKDLNEKYQVQGSPTLVINDKTVQLNDRSPESFKEAVCQAFTSEPDVCNQKLSEKVPSPGIGGIEDSNNNSQGTCQ